MIAIKQILIKISDLSPQDSLRRIAAFRHRLVSGLSVISCKLGQVTRRPYQGAHLDKGKINDIESNPIIATIQTAAIRIEF